LRFNTLSRFTTSGYWLSFVNVPDFVRSLYNPEDRSLMQPSLVFAGLALATLMKSSEMELGSAGRERAIWLRDKAQAWLEASWNSQWIDMTLAKAALVSVQFGLLSVFVVDILPRSLLCTSRLHTHSILPSVRDALWPISMELSGN
jgi:hypothetical protein